MRTVRTVERALWLLRTIAATPAPTTFGELHKVSDLHDGSRAALRVKLSIDDPSLWLSAPPGVSSRSVAKAGRPGSEAAGGQASAQSRQNSLPSRSCITMQDSFSPSASRVCT